MGSSRLFGRIVFRIGLPVLAMAVALILMASVEPDPGGSGLGRVTTALLVVAATGTWFVLECMATARHSARGAELLQKAAAAAEQGDFSARIEINRRDEWSATALAFGQMRETLARRLSELQQNRDRMAAVLSGMVEGVLAVDTQQRVLLANEACRRLLSIPTRDVVGRPLLELIRNLDVQQIISSVLQGTELESREISLSASGRRTVRVLATRLEGTPCPGVVVVLHDITELRRLESLRRDFVANVSHELKTPLSVIKAYAETLRLGAIHDQEHNLGFVERIEEQATRLHRLIVDLLQLARVETGKEAFEFRPVSLPDMLRTAVEPHAGLAESAGVTVKLEPPAGDVIVWADLEGVRVMVENLVTNAIKFTPAPGTVTLRCRVEGRFGVFEVQDTGIGIGPADRTRVFERFYRTDKARSRDMGGTGLGLAIVKHLAQAFGGEVGLTSDVGRGSTFQVRIPLAQGRS